MKKFIVVIGILSCLTLLFKINVFAQDIVWQEISRGNTNLKTVLVDSQNPHIIYIGSNKGIFKTEDSGLNWRNILSIRGQNKTVNFLSFDPKNKNFLYAATGNGLYFSSNQGSHWKRVFQGKNYLERECTALAILPYAMYLGTKSGLFVSKDKGHTWQNEAGNIGKSRILAIASDIKEPDYIYVACVAGVFKTQNSGEFWERIFVTHPVENGSDIEEQPEDQSEEGQFSDIRYITIDHHNLNNLYLATSHGIYISHDRGGNWELLSDYGLLSRDVRFLLVSSKSALYAVTKSGIFEHKNDRWQELSLGLAAEEVKFLSLDNQGNLYAACDKGLFKANIGYLTNDRQENIIALYYKGEPSVKEVQQAAIKYAEVDPEKIARWRKQAEKRALLPKLTVGMDRDKDKTISKSIWGTYSSNSTPGRHYVGPDDETAYNNKNWDVSLTWELGDLIWNNDQTNIDVRSRLMVQLRDDILDEVTKLYFERIRVKMELDNLSIEDRKKRFEKELRLQELTAYLDALTAGYFSQQLKNKP